MLFNSFEYALFLPIIFIIYWFILGKNIKLQNLLILAASYIFYGWWDWRFLFLILFSTLTDYLIGIGLYHQENFFKKKCLLWISIIINLGFLGVLKYYNFFLDSLYNATPGLQTVLGFNTLDIILPVGISFYTFQTLSYTIDIYKRKLKPTKDFIAFAAFVAFFPQLVAGPIERATNLLPQFFTRRFFNYKKAVDGLKQILWGLFKKIVIADNCAEYANLIFNNSDDYSGSTLFLGAVLFAFQIYGDFSGYSDIAIGSARLFGFNLMRNFAFPYFSRDIAEFWRRWHISLSTWFRDYIYIPLGGSRGGLWCKIRNTFIIFIISGFWHGANWTFIVWGGIHALYFLPLILLKRNRKNIAIVASDNNIPSIKEIFGILSTFLLTTIAWVFFRAKDISHAVGYLTEMLSYSLFTVPDIFPVYKIFLVILFIATEWYGRKEEYAIAVLGNNFPKGSRWAAYYLILISIFLLGNFSESVEFIYFQF